MEPKSQQQKRLFPDLPFQMPKYHSFKMPTFPDVRKYCVSFGVGVDSTAVLAIMHAIGFRPDIIIFADPGSEWNETYDYYDYFEELLKVWGFPIPTLIRRQDILGPKAKRKEPLVDECFRLSTVPNERTGKLGAGIPSVSFGHHRCSMKFKAEAINGYLKKQVWVQAEMEAGYRIAKVIGYESTETGRSCTSTFADVTEASMAIPCYPLMTWGVDREAAVAILKDMGIRVPLKSACTFCPNAQDEEWIKLANTNPVAFEVALRMEALARPFITKPEEFGLHRRGKVGERQLVDWARSKGLPVPNNLQDIEAAKDAQRRASERARQFWAKRKIEIVETEPEPEPEY